MAFVFGNIGTPQNDYVFNFRDAPTVEAGAGNDIIIAYGNEGPTDFVFRRGDGNDQIFGFNAEEGDTLHFANYSPKEITFTQGAQGGRTYTDVSAGGLGGQSPNANHVRVWDTTPAMLIGNVDLSPIA